MVKIKKKQASCFHNQRLNLILHTQKWHFDFYGLLFFEWQLDSILS